MGERPYNSSLHPKAISSRIKLYGLSVGMYQFESQDASFRCSGQDELCYQLSFVEQNFLLLLYRVNLPICTRNSLPLSRDLSGVFLLSTEARKGKNKQIKHE